VAGAWIKNRQNAARLKSAIDFPAKLRYRSRSFCLMRRSIYDAKRHERTPRQSSRIRDVFVPLGIYVLGVVIGLARVDGKGPVRAGIALAWPLGPLALIVTIATLLLASLIAFPWFGVAVAVTALAGWILA
jgi:hypothetical protein